MRETDTKTYKQLYTSHPRQWRDFDYVYPVLSRRSGGLSIGVNLNPDKVCNWDCVYCQVDRTIPAKRKDVDLDQLGEELDWLLGYAASGAIWSDESFKDVPAELRRINDIAFSGDGEPTTYSWFDEACQLAADLKSKHGLDDTTINVLTNMTMAHRDVVQRGFAILDENNGEIWAKLEAGSQEYYDQIDRSPVKLQRVLDNLRDVARKRPVVIQSMWMRLHDEPPTNEQFDAFIDRVIELRQAGARFKLIQLYTIARDTTEAYATPLSDTELDTMGEHLKKRLPDVPAQMYYGVG